MGKLSRTKGKTFERTVAKAFREVFPDAKRTLTQQRDSGEEPDINVPGWWVEAKHHRKVPIRKAFEQAVDEVGRAKSKGKPVAVTMDNRTEPLATLRLPDFVEMLRRYEELLLKNTGLVQEVNLLVKGNRKLAENQRGPADVSAAAHLAAVDFVLDREVPLTSFETTRSDRIRALAAAAKTASSSSSVGTLPAAVEDTRVG